MRGRTLLFNHVMTPGLILGFLALLGTVSEVHPSGPAAQPTQGPSQGTGTKPLVDALRSVPAKPPDTWDIVVQKLALAGVLGLVLATVYRASYTRKQKKYRPSMMQTELLLCVGGALVWIIVGNNIARAFGIGGALAFIRFRTPLRDPKDTVVIFLSMLVGMACGLGLYHVALIATGFISLVLLAMYQFRLGEKKKKPESQEASPANDEQD